MSQVDKIILRINGMSCNGCKSKVENVLKSISGVTNVSVDLEKREAIIAGSVSSVVLVKAVKDLGFKVIA